VKITQEEEVDRQTVLNIELEDSDLDPYLEMGYRKVAPRLRLPGFRPGKAPRGIVQQYLGKEALLNEVLDTMLPECTDKAIQENNIDAASTPNIELEELDPITFKATIPLRPEITLGTYLDIRLEREDPTVGEEDVQERLDQIRQGMALWEPVDRDVELGDLVTMTAKGTVEEEDIINEENVDYFLDKESVNPFPGFAEHLVGMASGTESEFGIEIPQDFSDTNLAGKTVDFSVTISEIKKQTLPELNDEFAKGVGDGYESLESLTAEIKKDAQEAAATSAKQEYTDSVLNTFLEGVTIAVAPVMINHEVDHMLGERSRVLAQMNIRVDDYLRSIGQTEDAMREEMREEAESRIKRTFALTNLAEEEGLEISDEEIDTRIESIQESNSGNPENLPIQPEFTEEMRETVRRMLLSEKTIDRLLAIAGGEGTASLQQSDDPASNEGSDQ